MAKPHYLRAGGRTKTPAVILTFDTETRPVIRDGQEVLTLRCWDAMLRHRVKDVAGEDFTEPWEGETPKELALTLEAAAAITGEAWVFAHNAGFDLTVTSLPMVLAEMGWEPDFVNIGDETCVFAMSWAGRKLIITDTWSWLRCGLDTAAKDVGMRKTRLPDDQEDLDTWHRRCRHDVEILDRIMAQLLDWWDQANVGSFGVTGSSCGWRTLRARIPDRTVLVGVEQPRTSLEREAIFGGRREVYQVGRVRGRHVEDWDLTAAHLTTMAALPLPTVPVHGDKITPPPSPLAPPTGLGAVCRVEITTEVPCAPVRALDDVWWPVGTFQTTLTTPELAEVIKDADRVEILHAQWYRLTDALQPWARWCLELQAQPDDQIPRVVKRVAKGWGRAVPGRFALRTSQLIREAPATHLGWSLTTGHDLDTGDALETLTYGGVARTYRKDQDGADVSPVVLAFVEGYVRAAMAQILRSRPPGELLQVNTDGWWEIRPGRAGGDAAAAPPAPYRAVRKAVTRDVTVYGPNHLDSAGDRRLAGVPKTASRLDTGAYVWQDWPGLRWQLQFSRPGEYLRPGRELILSDHYCRRWVLTSGETVPVSCRLTSAGRLELLPWSQTACRRDGDELAPYQVPALQELADAGQEWAGAAGASTRHLPGRRLPGLSAA